KTGKSKKVDDESKQRDKGRMDVFPCHGWLHVTISEAAGLALVKLNHDVHHTAYWWKTIPDNVQDLIKQCLDVHVWKKVLMLYPSPRFKRKSVIALWREQTSEVWKRDPDPVKSAQILMDEASKRTADDRATGLYAIDPVALHEEEGYTAFSFVLPDILRRWAVQQRGDVVYDEYIHASVHDGRRAARVDESL
ncbi:hypothetical protein BKA70DRAFT_1130968, partial [Coprinopsis sp. MPI-PUGE-AT-0042]